MLLRFIGDVHQRYQNYLPLLKGADYSIQVGDLGFDYTYLDRMGLDTSRHRAIAGNHDNYGEEGPNFYRKQSVFLPDYGLHEIPGLPPIFFARGAWSIDNLQRKRAQGWPYNLAGPVTWWETEELSHDDFEAAIALYRDAKPEIVVTHEAPMDLVQHVTNPEFAEYFGHPPGTIRTRTNIALQVMFDAHQPKHWIFGHYHVPWFREIGGTNFRCLDMIRGKPDDMERATWDLAFGS